MWDRSCAPTSGRVRYILERTVSPRGDSTNMEEIMLVLVGDCEGSEWWQYSSC